MDILQPAAGFGEQNQSVFLSTDELKGSYMLSMTSKF